MHPNLSNEPNSPLTDFENFSEDKFLSQSQDSITANIIPSLTNKKLDQNSQFNSSDIVKSGLNNESNIYLPQINSPDRVCTSVVDEKNTNDFRNKSPENACIKLTSEKCENRCQAILPHNVHSNLINEKTNNQLPTVLPNSVCFGLIVKNTSNHTQDSMPDNTCSILKNDTNVNQLQNILSDKTYPSLKIEKTTIDTPGNTPNSVFPTLTVKPDSNQLQDKSPTIVFPGLMSEKIINQTPESLLNIVCPKLMEDADQTQEKSSVNAFISSTSEKSTALNQDNMCNNIIFDLKNEKNSNQLQNNASRTSFTSPAVDQNVNQLQDSTLDNTCNVAPESKNKPTRANKLLLPVMPPAEDFVYSPEIYNEEYLLKEYPQTFKSPAKVDVLTLSSEELTEIIEKICVSQGEPLVIQNFHKLEGFDAETFSLEWLKKAYNEKEVRVRDLTLKQDVSLSFNEFLSSVEDVPYSDIRYYGKDIECPAEWETASKHFLPPYLQYMGPTDLNGLLDDRLKIDNLMIYVGHEGTHTATHFDMCGSVGHNLMVQADEGCSALWFMVAQDNANDARKFWHNYGGGNTTIDQDNCILPAHIMGLAGFPIYTFQQTLGDFVIVPSETPHQVVNIGKGCTIKFSWNRNTATSLSHCINSVLHVNRRILKMETYRTKTMVEQGVIQWGKILEESNLSDFFVQDRERFCRDYKILLQLYATIISSDVVDTSYEPIVQKSPKISTDSYSHSRVCDFCRCDIWNNWFHCENCPINKKLEIYGHDLCVNCFAENRKCLNYQELEWFCHRPIKKCIKDLVKFSKLYNNSPVFLGLTSHELVPIFSDFKSFEDLHPGVYSPITLAVKVNDHYKIADHLTCHQCAISRFNADMIFCSTCVRRFCCGCISNRYAVNPFELARIKGWQCFYCIKKCNCAKCARKFGEDNVIPIPPNPFCLKDYYENYYLGYGLSYFPVGESKILIPNVVDFQTFLGRKKGLDKATDPKIMSNLIPYADLISKSASEDIHIEEENANKTNIKRKSRSEEAQKRRSKKNKDASETEVLSKNDFETVENSVYLKEEKTRSRKRTDNAKASDDIKDNPDLADLDSEIKPPRKRGRPRKTPLSLTKCLDTDFTKKAVLAGEDNITSKSQSNSDTEKLSSNDLIESNGRKSNIPDDSVEEKV